MSYANLKRGVLMAAPALALALVPALAQPPSRPAAGQPGQPGADRPGRQGGGRPQSEWVEKYRDSARDHPRLTRSLINLHDTKDYLQKAGHEFGGHKAAAIKDIDAAILELEAAMKAEPKVEPPADQPGQPQRRRRGGGGGDAPPPPNGK